MAHITILRYSHFLTWLDYRHTVARPSRQSSGRAVSVDYSPLGTPSNATSLRGTLARRYGHAGCAAHMIEHAPRRIDGLSATARQHGQPARAHGTAHRRTLMYIACGCAGIMLLAARLLLHGLCLLCVFSTPRFSSRLSCTHASTPSRRAPLDVLGVSWVRRSAVSPSLALARPRCSLSLREHSPWSLLSLSALSRSSRLSLRSPPTEGRAPRPP